ncbi:CNVH-domain-containing protein [Mycena venus]|uniref:CNVH-domain-containing protein n=1 Tax=Mycena venus TaxID=2733690 RepID=A0A8H6X6Z2_9AGAR|nr:CNVH-domain-containing protein [Mycena venus]
MKIILSSSNVLVLCAVVSFGAPFDAQTGSTANSERAANDQFLATCRNTMFDVQTVTLTSTCENLAGRMVTSSISLDSCLSNDNGQLVAQIDGSFSLTCQDITFLGVIDNTVTLTARCEAFYGPDITSSIDLNTVVDNNNGFLTCP